MAMPKLRFKNSKGKDYPKLVHCELGDIAEYLKKTGVGCKLTYVSTDNMQKDCNGVIFDSSNIENLKGIIYEEKNILISNIRPYLKKAWFANTNGVCSTDVLVLKAKNNVLPEYLYTILSSNSFFNYVMTGVQGTKMPRGNKEHILQMPITIPSSLEEQEKIAFFLTELDNLISASDEEVKALEDMKKGYMQKIFSQELRFKADDGSEYPEWEAKQLSDLGSLAMCKRILKEQTSEIGDIPFYKIGTFGSKPDAYISKELFEHYKKKYRYPKNGTPLVSASGTIGRVVVYNGEEAYYQDSNIVWLEHGAELNDGFLSQFYTQVKWNDLLEGTTIKRLYNTNFLKLVISVPCLEEQQKIADFFTALDESIETAKQELEQYRQLKKAMLQQLFV